MDSTLAGIAPGMGADASALSAFLSVVLIDVVLAGDNAIVVGMAAAGLPANERRKVVFWGIAAAAVLRIGLAVITMELLGIIGLTLAGGLLLLWVCWKLWRELRPAHSVIAGGPDQAPSQGKTFRQAVIQIVLADVSMSLDNVLAVAGAARDHLTVLIIGLALSVALMGFAAALVARLLQRYHWIAYIGLGIIAYVAVKMIYEGGIDVIQAASAI
jgi:YjbE family integral membrane protein